MTEYKVRVYENKTEWRNQKDELHRLNGPATEEENGSKVWYVDGKRHRLDGPAVELDDGSKSWWKEGELHRDDGPAIEYPDGFKSWYIYGIQYSEEGFKNKIREIKSSCEGKVVEIDGIKYQLKKI